MDKGGESQLHPEIAKDSGNDLSPSGNKSLDSNTQGSKVRRSERGTIPHHHFEIERESLICASLDFIVGHWISYERFFLRGTSDFIAITGPVSIIITS